MPYAIAAYLIWGFIPLYLRLLERVPSLQIVLHRMLWSAVFMAVVIAFSRGWQAIPELKKANKHAATLLLTSFLIGSNWFVYVYAVNHAHVLETSFGYFLCPLVIVFLGRAVLKERWDTWQKVSVTLASVGVFVLFWKATDIPIYALYLAITFALYALIRKRLSIPPLIASTWEMLVMSVVAMAVLGILALRGELFPASNAEIALFLGAGVVTALPLWWFTEAGSRLPLKTLGILQYLAPCFQFLCAVWIFQEPFGTTEALGFGFIWLAIAVYILRLLKRR